MPEGPAIVGRRTILALLLVLWIAFIFDLALFRFPAAKPVPNLIPLRSIIADWRAGGSPFVINFLGNIVAFLPMGALPPLIRRRRTALWQMVLFSLALSLVIELGQFFSGRRVPDVDDLILNTLGGVIGYRLANHRAARGARSAQV
jgi:glycopeptide antibiotics resistance protein